MPDYDIEVAAEKAMQAWLRSKKIDWVQPLADDLGNPIGQDRIYCGLQNEDIEENEGEDSSIIRLPCIICCCEQADPILPNFHGNWHAEIYVEVRSAIDEVTGKQHAQRVQGLYQYLYTTTLAQDLSAAIPEFYTARATPARRGYEVIERTWRHKLYFSLISASAVHMS